MIFGFTEITPLPISLLYAAGIDQSITQHWQGPFVVSSIVAMITTTILRCNKVLLNRLMIGINAYLITGSLGLLTNPDWTHQVYEKLKASGMLTWIIIVGVISLLISPAGFIGVNSQGRKKLCCPDFTYCLQLRLPFLSHAISRGIGFTPNFPPLLPYFPHEVFCKKK